MEINNTNHNKNHNKNKKTRRINYNKKLNNATYYAKHSQNCKNYYQTHIVNLSSYSPTLPELCILSKGLNFIPTPSPSSDSSLFHDAMQKFTRSLRLIYFFRNSKKLPSKKHPFKPPSMWNPPKASNDIEQYIHKTSSNPPTCNLKTICNISKQERKAIHSLKNNQHIIIKKADKGSSIVIQDKDTYIQEGMKHLGDPKTYTELRGDPTNKVAQQINTYIDKIYCRGYIDEYTKTYLQTPTPCRTHRMYFLTKIHKNPHGIRPIVSCIGGLTAHISAFLDNLIKPLAMRTNSYIKDTSHILHLLSNLHVPSNSFLVTIDVKSLYTCIPQDEGTQACIEAIQRAHITDIPLTVLKSLFQIVLQCNIIRFNDKIFTQITGTAMGTIMAPNYAILFMDKLETAFLESQSIKPLIWKRYIDDILMIWTGTETQLALFLDNLNSFHQNIKFTYEISQTNIIFLDLEIYKGPHFQSDNTLSTKTHFKATNTFQYLHFSSCHPRNTFKGIVKGEAIRFLRANTEEKNFTIHIKDLKRHLSYRGYPNTFTNDCLKDITYNKRPQYLIAPTIAKVVSITKSNNIPRFIITYSPYLNTLRKCLLQFWPPSVSSFMERPQISYKKNKSISNYLVRAQLVSDPPSEFSTYHLPILLSVSRPRTCSDYECHTCKRIIQQITIQNTIQNKTYSILQNSISCRQHNVVYALKCNTCSMLYIGRTKPGQTLRARHLEHIIRSREKKNKSWPVYRHYKKHQLTFENNHAIIPLQALPHHHLFRLSKFENIWIHKLNTIHPHGLNLTTAL